MQVVREIYDNMPDTLTVPETLRHRRVEVILLVLDEVPKKTDALGWPEGFFEETAGCLADDPIERATTE